MYVNILATSMLTQGARSAECIIIIIIMYILQMHNVMHACICYTYAGRSLHFAPSLPEISVDSGNNAVLQCVLDGDSTHHGGSFSWTGPAVASGRAVITLNLPGTVSTLSIAAVDGSDEGKYSCSFTGVDTISITLDVVCKLPATDLRFTSSI